MSFNIVDNILYGGPDPINSEQGASSLGEWCLTKIVNLNENSVCLVSIQSFNLKFKIDIDFYYYKRSMEYLENNISSLR